MDIPGLKAAFAKCLDVAGLSHLNGGWEWGGTEKIAVNRYASQLSASSINAIMDCCQSVMELLPNFNLTTSLVKDRGVDSVECVMNFDATSKSAESSNTQLISCLAFTALALFIAYKSYEAYRLTNSESAKKAK